ncbi:MAG: histidine kinase dimerization/phospho-acceptor domain-containing protein, partial [Myxococcales bacterium]
DRHESVRQRRDGALRDVAVWASPVRNADGSRQCILVIDDITERRRAEQEQDRAARRMTILAEVGELLASSLDYETTLRNIISLCIPTLGDFGFFDVVEGEEVRRLARAHEDPARQAILDQSRWVRSERRDMNLCALSSGEPGMHPGIDDAWLQKVAVGPEHLAVMKALSFGSMLTVPLRYDGALLGSLTLFFNSPGRQHDQADMQIALDVARRAASALVNARLYRDARAAIAARDDFLSIASHELRTPLTSIQLHVGTMLRHLKDPARGVDPGRLQERLERTDAQLARLTTLIGQLLDVSRLSSSRMDLDRASFDLAELVREVAARHAEQSARA